MRRPALVTLAAARAVVASDIHTTRFRLAPEYAWSVALGPAPLRAFRA